MYKWLLKQITGHLINKHLTRPPDFVIGENYLQRWYLIPRNRFCNVYLHVIKRSDDDRALHDHPWMNLSIVLVGRYREHQPGGVVKDRHRGDIIARRARTPHRLEIVDGNPALTLFITGPKTREWGFWCPWGWRHWREFTSPNDKGKIGRGCD